MAVRLRPFLPESILTDAKLYPLIALTIELLHFEYFLQAKNVTVDEECIEYLRLFQEKKRFTGFRSINFLSHSRQTESHKLIAEIRSFRAKNSRRIPRKDTTILSCICGDDKQIFNLRVFVQGTCNYSDIFYPRL